MARYSHEGCHPEWSVVSERFFQLAHTGVPGKADSALLGWE
jgi:hypothetical protein